MLHLYICRKIFSICQKLFDIIIMENVLKILNYGNFFRFVVPSRSIPNYHGLLALTKLVKEMIVQ